MELNRIKEKIDRFFNGQYVVKKFLGEGSFSRVYLVKHRFLDDLRAIKIINEPIKLTTNTKNIFREVQIATQLRHENIISIYDAGIISGDDDLAYFVMEYVPGGDLEGYLNSFINSDISMPIKTVLNLMKQISMGLNVLHSSNPPIVHRDLKLNNILLNYNACGDIIIKISDFGFAKEVTTNISDVDVVGTRPYMAPECFKGKYSAQSDIYAVGVIFYKLITSHYPYDVIQFKTHDLIDLKPWKTRLKKPSQYNKNIPEKLDDIVLKCLEFDFKKRYSDASELLADVELLIDELEFELQFDSNYIENEHIDDYSDFIINNSLKEAFKLAKTENGLVEAIGILEREVLRDYNVRKFYGETLRMWKSKRPDVKLISKAFTVSLKAKNYAISCDLLMEAIAYNPSLKIMYGGFIELYEIFIDFAKDKNLIKAVISLEDLMRKNTEIYNIYSCIINVLKTFDVEHIVSEAIRLVKMNNLVDAANLMEFAVVYDDGLRQKYEYKLSLWKQNLEVHYKNCGDLSEETIDFAIDLGTADSIISYYNNGNPIIIKNHATGDDVTPSAVLIANDEIHVGNLAKDAIMEKKSNAITKFKENMGFPIQFNVKDSSRTFLPEELSAEVLKDLRLSAFMQCGYNVDHAVVCIPANSNPLQTRAIRDACDLAGFRSYNLVFEPIAVAIAYGLKASEKNNGLWLIYDLGGSTFKASLIRDNGKVIEQVATVGLDNFGGNSLDWKVVDELFLPKIAGDLDLVDFNRNNSKYDNAFSKLKKASEIAKINLSKLDKTEIIISNLFTNYDFKYSLTREEFKQTIMPSIKNTLDLVNNLINRSSYEFEDIDRIILVGGSCLSPTVKEIVMEEFDLPVEDGIDPLTAVAQGAAIYAGSLKKPKTPSIINPVSLILNKNKDMVSGKLFSLDDKDSFLGFGIEFVNQKDNYSTGKLPLSLEGKFSTNLYDGVWNINVYDGDELVEIDDKSPNKINLDGIYIPFFKRYFSFNEDCIEEYDKLVDLVVYLNEYGRFDDWDMLNYVERLIRLGDVALNQKSIYLNYLNELTLEAKCDLEFSTLLENVKNKINILEVDVDLTSIVKDRDFDRLVKVHESLIEKYVLLNGDKVIEECFFNLRIHGIYVENQVYSNELIDEAFSALESSDYDKLFEIVNELYRIDERRDHGRR